MNVAVSPLGSPRRSRRDELLHTAAILFAERGFAGVTVDDIGAAVGISGPAIYHHFTGKEALLGEMLVSISEWLLHNGQRIVSRSPNPARARDELIAFHTEFAVDRAELIAVQNRDLVHASEEDQHTVRRLQAAYVDQWVGVLEALNAGLDRSRARAAVHATFGLLNSTSHSRTTRATSRAHADDVVTLLREMAERALAL